MQIEALWQYLLEGRQARTPKGLVLERIELLATQEAIMLRRSWPDVGKRGIGVGYPSQVNLVFDAEQMRLATLWQGRFADPSGVWRSQGQGMARPLEREAYPFAHGPDLDDASQPSVVDDGRPPQHHFKGYVLDQLRRPAFRYRFENVDVTDYLVDSREEASNSVVLRRRISFVAAAPRPGLALRIASGEEIVPRDDGSYLIGKKLQVRVLGDHQVVMASRPDGVALSIPLDIPPGESQVTVHYSWTGAER